MTIAQIRSGQIIRQFSSSKGWFTLEGGGKVSPPVVGYVNGNDKIVPVEIVTVDNSTPASETVSDTVVVVEANRVLRTTTIRDKTVQEITDERDAALAELDTQSRDLQYAVNIHVKEITAVLFSAINTLRVADGDAVLTIPQFKTFWDNNSDAITLTQFKTYLQEKQS